MIAAKGITNVQELGRIIETAEGAPGQPALHGSGQPLSVEATFCNPAAGWEKGQIEKTVRDARRHIWQDLPAFADLVTLNAWLEARCLDCWERLQHIELARTIADVHASRASSPHSAGASL
ncbi:hypothetical protein AA0616_3011 [Komagataeibacter nataicola NRIC 0616]|nr:hypothetical protein AA0616_3011 [Komagataeibacter nataicola NRIC 0616]